MKKSKKDSKIIPALVAVTLRATVKGSELLIDKYTCRIGFSANCTREEIKGIADSLAAELKHEISLKYKRQFAVKVGRTIRIIECDSLLKSKG